MIQPIDRETAIALLRQVGALQVSYNKDRRQTEHSLFDDEAQHLCNLAVAHSRKDAEPVAKLTFEAAWAEMEKRGYRYGRDALAGVKFGWKLHEDWNTTNPPEADKLLQQALEAVLDEHLPGFTEDAPRQHDDVIYDKAIEDAADAIQQLIARTYLEGKK